MTTPGKFFLSTRRLRATRRLPTHFSAPRILPGLLHTYAKTTCVVVFLVKKRWLLFLLRPPQSIINWLQKEGVTFHFETPVTRVHDGSILTSSGDTFNFDRLLICSGDELRLLYPKHLQQAQVIRCKLQMMETAPQGSNWHLTPIVASELTLRHYTSFKPCVSLPQLQRRLERSLA